MDVVELTEVGTKIAEVGGKLKERREQRKVIDEEIALLEVELRPLLLRHSQILADVIGAPIAPPAPPPVYLPPSNGGGPPLPPAGPNPKQAIELKKRIIKFLEDAEPGTSAADVATALNLDPLTVRAVMGEMARSGR